VFTSYADFSNITAASFLRAAGKQTPVFVRFSTVAGSKGSSDAARDVHGFATRFYTDEGNFGGFNFPLSFFVFSVIFFLNYYCYYLFQGDWWEINHACCVEHKEKEEYC
jgi:catalase